MGYSKMVSIEVTNFMVYKHAKVTFDNKNIINIKGYNSSGKSTMLKAAGVCLMNLYSHDQAKFIRHGEEYFRIIVSFDDGVSILRDKYINGQSLYEVYKDGERVFTTKEGSRLARVDDVPELIQNYLGLCMLSTGCLNYQSRQDRLWLIETKGSENYLSLNEILKTEEIARAYSLLNTDKNALNSEISGMEATLQGIDLELQETSGYSEELLSHMESAEDRCRLLTSKYASLCNILSIMEALESLKVLPEVEKLDEGRLGALESITFIVDSLSELKPIPSLSQIEVVRLQMIASLDSECKSYEKVAKQVFPSIEPLSQFNQNEALDGILSILTELNEVASTYNKVETAISDTSAKLDKAVAVAKKQGIQFVKCDNCGSYMEVVSNG